MSEITTTRAAMALAAAAAAAYVVGSVLACIAYAILSGPNAVGTSDNLITAAAWMTFVAAAVAWAGVSWAAWSLVVEGRWADMWEVIAADVGILLIAIGELVQAVRVPRTPESSRVLLAVGLGVWAILAIVRAGGTSLTEQGRIGAAHQAPLWAAASLGLFVAAIGWGLPTASVLQRGQAIADGVVPMVGFGILALAVLVARQQGFLSRHYPSVVLGLFMVAVAYGVSAIVGGVVYGLPVSVTALRVGLPIEFFVIAVALALLGVGAWDRVRDLTVVEPAQPTVGYWGPGAPPPAAAHAPGVGPRSHVFPMPVAEPAAQYCIQCGQVLPPEARFCPACGASVREPAR